MNSKKLDYVYKVGGDKQPASVNLKSTEWAVLTQMDGKKSVLEISDILNMNSAEITLIVEILEEQTLIENTGLSDTVADYLPPEFFEEMEQTFIRIIGPVASIIIDDVLIELKKNRENFEVEEMSTLVEAISAEIDDETKKLTFQQKMLKMMEKF